MSTSVPKSVLVAGALAFSGVVAKKRISRKRDRAAAVSRASDANVQEATAPAGS